MSDKKTLAYFSAIGGFVGGFLSLLVLYWWVRPENFRPVLLIPFEWSLFFPVAGAFFSAAISTRFNPQTFGAAKGVLVAIFAYLAFCLSYGLVVTLIWAFWGMPGDITLLSAFYIPIAFVMFGGIFVGWVLLPVGAVYGALYKWRSNNSLKRDRPNRAAP